MCPRDDSYRTIAFEDHYVIAPAIKFFHRSNNFTSNALNELGKPVDSGFEYVSDTNQHFLSIEEITQFNEEAQK